MDAETRAKTIAKLAAKLQTITFDTIVVSGVSGVLIVAELSAKLNKPFAIVRKDNDGSHSCYEVEFSSRDDQKTYVIVDDLVDSGRTVEKIRKKMSTRDTGHMTCVGVVVYHGNYYGRKIDGITINKIR